MSQNEEPAECLPMIEESPNIEQKALQEEVVFLPLGGVGEIGMNLYLYGIGPAKKREWLMVDLGITFADSYEAGIEIILPDIDFILAHKDRLSGLLLTHAHEDHFGAVIDLLPRLDVPVWATPYTAALLRLKMRDNRVPSDLLQINEIALSSRFNIGSFDLEMVNMSHSIPEPNGVVIRMPGCTIFHSGDWKFDTALPGEPGLDEKRLREIGKEGVDVMISDSTNAPNEGESSSERDVEKVLTEIIAGLKHRAVVTTFASNLARVIAVARASKAAGRSVVVAGKAIWRVIDAARETGYLDDDLKFLDTMEYGYLPRDKVVLLCTGSQGEGRAAMARLAKDEHPHIGLSKEDTVIFSSKSIPGNEKSVSRIQNMLIDSGINIITNKNALVHVSGHPPRGDMAKLYEWISPAAAIPMHGEAYHLESHAEFARRQGVKDVKTIRNGQVIRLGPGKLEVREEVPSGRLYRDGNILVKEDDAAVRERRRLSYVGVLVISLVMSRKHAEPVARAQIFTQGVPELEHNNLDLAGIIEQEIRATLKSMPLKIRKDTSVVSEAIRRAVRARINNIWGKKTVVEVMVGQADV